MSVHDQTIVLYGWNIGTGTYKEYDPDPESGNYKNELADKYGWRGQSAGDVACVFDGMAGKYCYFGVVVAATNTTRDGHQRFENKVEIPVMGPAISTRQARELNDAVDEMGIEPEENPKHYIFTHTT